MKKRGLDINGYLLGLLRCVFRGTAAGSARAISTIIQNHLIIFDYHLKHSDALLKKKAEIASKVGIEKK